MEIIKFKNHDTEVVIKKDQIEFIKVEFLKKQKYPITYKVKLYDCDQVWELKGPINAMLIEDGLNDVNIGLL